MPTRENGQILCIGPCGFVDRRCHHLRLLHPGALPYAINGSSIRSVDSADDCMNGEVYHEQLPTLWPPGPTTDQQLATLQAGVQQWLDSTAKANGYDSIASCCSYYNSGVVQWAADAKAATAWRDAVWQACYAQSAAISVNRHAKLSRFPG